MSWLNVCVPSYIAIHGIRWRARYIHTFKERLCSGEHQMPGAPPEDHAGQMGPKP